MSKPLVVVSLALALSSGANVAFAQNLVSDGDFSNSFSTGGSAGEGYVNFAAGATFGAWTVLSGNVDRVTTGWNAPLTGNSVDLDGNTPSSIGQFLNLAAGSYQLSFYLTGNPTATPLAKNVRVQVGNLSQTFTYTIAGVVPYTPPLALSYVLQNASFTASGPTQLSFTSLGSGFSLAGPVIGNISIVAVPEPTNLVLFTAGLLALICFRARAGEA